MKKINTNRKLRAGSVLGALALTIGLVVVPGTGAFAQGIVYKTGCGVQYTGFSNQGTIPNGGLVASTRRASAGCGGNIFVTARSAGSATYLGTSYSSGNYIGQTTNGSYYAPGASHSGTSVSAWTS